MIFFLEIKYSFTSKPFPGLTGCISQGEMKPVWKCPGCAEWKHRQAYSYRCASNPTQMCCR